MTEKEQDQELLSSVNDDEAEIVTHLRSQPSIIEHGTLRVQCSSLSVVRILCRCTQPSFEKVTCSAHAYFGRPFVLHKSIPTFLNSRISWRD